MQFLVDLWLPIAISAVVVFVASSILWMATPLHKGDYSVPPEEDDIRAAVKKHGFGPGMYYLPWCKGGHGNAAKDPAYQKRMEEGPWVLLMVPQGKPSFGNTLGRWFVSQVILAVVIAYAAHAAISLAGHRPEYLRIFQVVGAIALLAHGGMAGHDTMWKGLSYRHTVVKLVDAVVYASLTAGCFAALWPKG